MSNVDELTAKLVELTNIVKDNGGLTGLRRDEIVADFTAALDERMKTLQDSLPVRMGEVNVPALREAMSVTGKYAHQVREIADHGEAREGASRLKGIDLVMAERLMEKGAREFPERVKPASRDLREAVKALKAMTSTGAGTGDELVPTGMANSLWADFFAASRVASSLQQQVMPTDPFDVPLNLGDVTWRKGTQNTATTVSDPATAKSTLTSTEMVCEVDWSYDLDEDAVIAMMPALRSRLVLSGGEQMDAFVLNADATDAGTGNINLDDADPDADMYYLSNGQDGIRHQFLVNYTASGSSAAAAVSDAIMANALGKLGKYGLDYNQVRIVPDIATYLSMLSMTNVATVDKYGPNATVVQGELGRYRGIPIIPSASMPLTEADGKVSTTAGNNTKGQIAIFHAPSWSVGYRRGLTIEVDRLIQKRQLVMVASFRIAVGAFGTRTTAKHTAGIYNITV